MCLYVTSRVPERLKFKNGFCKVYKILQRGTKELTSPFRYTRYNPGNNVATGFLFQKEVIYGGAIHVYTDLIKARYEASSYDVIIPIFAKRKDFIAEGSRSDAAFKAIYIPKKMYKKALKCKNPEELISYELI